MPLAGERAILIGIWAAAAAGCLLGGFAPAGESFAPGLGREALDLVRVLCTTALAVTLLLFPGLLWRAASLISGGNPQLALPETPWQPFDPQGFMAFWSTATSSCRRASSTTSTPPTRKRTRRWATGSSSGRTC